MSLTAPSLTLRGSPSETNNVRLFYFSFLFLIFGCIHRTPTPETAEENLTPTRLLILFAAGVQTSDLNDDLPNLKNLAEKGIRFQNAQLGFLNSPLAYTVFDSGLFPKHLPHQDSITRSPSLHLSLKKLTAEPSVSNTSLSLPKETSYWITESSLNLVTDKALTLLGSSWSTMVLIYKPDLTENKWKRELKDLDAEIGKVTKALAVQKTPTLIVFTSPFGHSLVTNQLGKFPPFLRKQGSALPSPLAKLPGNEFIEAALADSYLRLWLNTRDYLAVSKLGVAMRSLPGVAEVFTKNTSGQSVHYIRAFRNEKLAADPVDHSPLLNNLASPESPEILVLFDEHSAYDIKFKTAGADDAIQKIPLILVSPNLRETGITSDAKIFFPDIHAMIRKLMNKEIPPNLDGTAVAGDI